MWVLHYSGPTTSPCPDGYDRNDPGTEFDKYRSLSGIDMAGFSQEDKDIINKKIRALKQSLIDDRAQYVRDLKLSSTLNRQIIKDQREFHLLDALDDR